MAGRLPPGAPFRRPALLQPSRTPAARTRWPPLAAQSDPDFCLALVDHASTDRSTRVAEDAVRAHPGLCAHRVTGAAEGNWARPATPGSATQSPRTRAGLPAPTPTAFRIADWILQPQARPRRKDGLEFVLPGGCGRAGRAGRALDRPAHAARDDRARRDRRPCSRAAAPQYLCPCFLVPGYNLAITGPPSCICAAEGSRARGWRRRTRMDRVLGERGADADLAGGAAPRKIAAHAPPRRVCLRITNTLRWYRNHGYRPAVVDIR